MAWGNKFSLLRKTPFTFSIRGLFFHPFFFYFKMEQNDLGQLTVIPNSKLLLFFNLFFFFFKFFKFKINLFFSKDVKVFIERLLTPM